MRIKSASLSAQCGGGPCDAMRYERGPAWNPNGTVDDSPQANGGIIRCGNSAETQSNSQPNSCDGETDYYAIVSKPDLQRLWL